MNNTIIPPDLLSIIRTESSDFIIKSSRNQPIKKSIRLILFATLWTVVTSVFAFIFFVPLFKGEEIHFNVNDVPTSASLENLSPLIIPLIIISIFVIIGIVMLISGFYSFYQKGGFFISTKNRLIKHYNGNVYSYDWEQFTGNIEYNTIKGDISLQLRTGRIVQRKDQPDEFVPDVIYISGITNVQEIETICRKRIKENDPTPTNIS